MAEYEITFGSFAGAVKHHWKLLLLTLVLFSAVGAGAGFLYAERSVAGSSYHADVTKFVSLQVIQQDKDYYYSCQDALEKACADLHTYFDSISSVSTLAKEDLSAIDVQRKEIDTLEKDYVAPIRKQLNVLDAIYVPDQFLPALIEYYENAQATTERNLIGATAAAEIVKNMVAPAVSDETSLSNYNALLSRAYAYTSYLQDLDAYHSRLERLRNDEDTIRADSYEMAQQQETAAEAIDALTMQAGKLTEELAEKRLLNIEVQYSVDDVLTVTTTHAHRTATVRENFQLIWLFCSLSGLCVGMFLTLCCEAGAFPRKKKQDR